MPGVTCKWVDTSVQLANCTTKGESERGYLRIAMASGNLTTTPDAKTIHTKEAIRLARHRRAEFVRELKREQFKKPSKETTND